MNTKQAFANGEMARATNAPMRVFDWDKAANLIKEMNAQEASAGLASDWEYTGGRIWADGKPVPREDTYTYLASIWATPEIEIDGTVMDCWRYAAESPGWDSATYWPDSARTILGIE